MTREGLLDTELYLALHAGDNGRYWATDLARMEQALREAGRCARQSRRGLPWFEFCGQALPCPCRPAKESRE